MDLRPLFQYEDKTKRILVIEECTIYSPEEVGSISYPDTSSSTSLT